MNYIVRYVAMDGEIRWREVEAENEEEARIKVLEEDAEGIGSGDSILNIIDIQ